MSRITLNNRARSARGGVGGLCPPAKARRERARQRYLRTSTTTRRVACEVRSLFPAQARGFASRQQHRNLADCFCDERLLRARLCFFDSTRARNRKIFLLMETQDERAKATRIVLLRKIEIRVY